LFDGPDIVLNAGKYLTIQAGTTPSPYFFEKTIRRAGHLLASDARKNRTFRHPSILESREDSTRYNPGMVHCAILAR